ncbi:MAG: flagellar hook-basal body protein [Syntrophaceticus sp.]
MIRGLYTAAAGMMAREAEVDVISNNMANVDTPGYRKDEALAASFPKMLLSRIAEQRAVVGVMGTGCIIDEVATSFAEGTMRMTGHPFDLALHGNGNAFFTVRDEDGELLYTRNGNFVLNENRMLVTGTGDVVLGEIAGEPVEIFVPTGNLVVDESGYLNGAVDTDGRNVTRLYLRAKPDDALWEKRGDTIFQGEAQEPAGLVRVEQGAYEGSNVDQVEEMIKLITATRAYEANAKVIQITDSTLDKLVNSVGSA